MKRKIYTVILAIALLISTSVNALASQGSYTWFIKRNGRDTPAFAREAQMVDSAGGYYIDKAAAENKDKVLYLTFDAGYENGNIEKILDILKKENVPAAFFILDNLILKNTDLVKRMSDEGHLVCNHTKNHRDLTKCTSDEITKNVSDLEKIYEEKTGNTLAKYFRFPEGRYSEHALKVVNDMGYKTIFWSFAYEDWDNAKQPSPEKALKKVLANTHDGAVILLHPTSDTNAKILPTLIEEWKSMGYRFGTLDELTK